MKKIILAIFISVFIMAALIWIYVYMPRETVKIFIPEGSNAIEISKILKRNNIIISSFYFKALVKLTKTDKKINPGEYVFMKYTPHEIVLYKMINQKYLNSIKVSIPEGWRAEQIAERLYKNGVIRSEKKFMEIVKKESLEGYLFPSTYYFNKNMSEEEVIKVFKDTFDKNIRPLFSVYKIPDWLDEYKVMIIASIVEREAVFDEERGLIAAVYLNRLKKKMPLEADPTVQYALGYWKKGLTYKDLEIPSPYNTYYVGGLPPTPICSPGKKSVEAVLNPAQIDAIYFVADNTGKHVFNVKYEEHLKAKEKAKRERMGR
ncbi:MAG: endolytic transglycosylase MltG [Elusimicrobiales bacterium]|nr:endolytic transglycosylase MltG [Elusimicrobiales bacterium]HOJ86661.1 endolytic transglycosylase MltG [Elusimicrobiales bacterium]HOL63402.1 endolytic transglycosylase MltG [Elusimicrobiales bacterium]HPO95730.1 endolytic transglycosylase MltG [Elusimicrobiales bacterium]